MYDYTECSDGSRRPHFEFQLRDQSVPAPRLLSRTEVSDRDSKRGGKPGTKLVLVTSRDQ